MWVTGADTSGEYLHTSVLYSQMFKSTDVSSRLLLLLVNTLTLVFTTARCLKALMWVASFVTSGEYSDVVSHVTNSLPSLNLVKFALFWDDTKISVHQKEIKLEAVDWIKLTESRAQGQNVL